MVSDGRESLRAEILEALCLACWIKPSILTDDPYLFRDPSVILSEGQWVAGTLDADHAASCW